AGMQLYVDHFSENLKGLENRLDYFEKLGVNFLHLMPITPRPKGENDGGYAVNSYHEVDKKYGTKKDLLGLTKKMRDRGMFLMLDFVANHTSDEFSWAKKAIAGDLKYQGYYYIYSDRTIPNAFEEALSEIFPITAPGNFTYNDEMQKWVMTVFNWYQWDLNYSNPEVFIEMLGNLLKLSNLGVDMIRLDALAFMWKKLGTQSQNLPEAHKLISLFRLCLQVIAPGVIFLAEAIVAPKEIIKYFGTGTMRGNECEIAYNATLMALLYDAIATKKTILLYKNLHSLPQKPDEATWINYLRCHDDIGLGFENRHIEEIGWNAGQHRKFLLDYYCQNIEWSPAKGLVFMYNPKTGDGRITGSCASLLGLEKALGQNDETKIERAIRKIIMLHGIILSYGGIPLIYAGDEIGTLNDYSYQEDLNKKDDNRWVNRPFQDWKAVEKLDKKNTYHSKIFFAIQHLIRLRKETPAFGDNNNIVLYHNPNPHVFVYERTKGSDESILIVCNFDDATQLIEKETLGLYAASNVPKDLITDKALTIVGNKVVLKSYQLLWLKR
ncbi:MAG: alpha amylase, partial [Pricia sp.]|nr:alpha amylase [Pricia sp.]